MVVTTNSMMTVRPSTWVPKSVLWPPMLNQVHSLWSTGWRSASSPSPVVERPTHWMRATTDRSQESPTAPIPTQSPWRGNRFPKRRMTQNETNGRAKMIQMLDSIGAALPLHEVDLGEVDRVAVAVDEQHDGQAHAHLGGGDGDHEEGEDLAGGRVVEEPEGDQVDVDGVEDQLNRHQHEHAVLAGQHTVDPDAEQERGKEQELVEVHQSRLAMTTAPTRAASSSTEMTSKGMT